jgi:prepilin-type N-terminal cleavage/methylation domain-containing protein
MFISNKKLTRGFSLVEMIIYVSILAIISVVVVNTILSFTGSYRDLRALRALDHASIGAMERMTRDIRASSSVTTAQSTLGSSPGALTLVATSGGVSTTTKFYIQNGVLRVDVNSVYSGPLTLSSTTVTSLIFNTLTSTVSTGVKVDMTIQSTDGIATRTKTYHSTVILRGQ